jgi:hypothetical protein
MLNISLFFKSTDDGQLRAGKRKMMQKVNVKQEIEAFEPISVR